MIEIFTTEAIVGIALISISLLLTIASLFIMRGPKADKPESDINALVRDAPYHRLREIGILVEIPPVSG